ncbi:PQQ-dependent sugar dehydrogenase [Thermasporomyces composti]|uniref:Glucose/arabinose dehydrogenase n=1 Tax=Thermasporomyces composti TaxID=696763 RepID=A0A3D9V156_THECX|nr:PQQ-dependent sugar dehydrogenase [Thermasporomyces composti]REF35257.1 glucose/arabinose dehydrogenase [Thermasporomyces composti]
MRRTIVLAVAAITLGVTAGCANPSTPAASPPPPSPPPPTARTPATARPISTPTPVKPARPTVDGTIVDDLTTPWGLAFLPTGEALVAERDTGRIKLIEKSGDTTTVGRVRGVRAVAESGLLGLAVAPTTGNRDPLVFAYVTTATDNRVIAMPYDRAKQELGKPRVILSGIPSGAIHNGGRMTFGPDGYLYIGTGDASHGDLAQDLDSLGGKILRITPDGKPAPGNPFPNSPVWSYGHRNVQGLAFDDDGRLWATEFGQDTWDELNLIQKGGNYGWPEVEGIATKPSPTTSPRSTATPTPSPTAGESDFIDPVAQWRPDDASPSGLAYAAGSLWMACLRGERLWRIQVDGPRVVGKPQMFFRTSYGRLRTVALAPDNTLWLTTSNTDGRGRPAEDDDRILRLRLTR